MANATNISKEKEQEMIVWFTVTAPDLARRWAHSMERARIGWVAITIDSIQDFLCDLWVKRNGEGPEFSAENFGMLYKYTLSNIQHGGEDAFHVTVEPLDFDNENKEIDYIDTLGSNDFNPINILIENEDYFNDGESDLDSLINLAERLQLLNSGIFTKSLENTFEFTDRQARYTAREIRFEKRLAVLKKAAAARGVTAAQLKKMAQEIALQHNGQGQEVKDFCEMMRIELNPLNPQAATSAPKTRSKPQKKTTPAQYRQPAPAAAQPCLF